MKKIVIQEKEHHINNRLDLFLAIKLQSYSRKAIKKYIEANNVNINGLLCYKAGYKVKIGDEIILNNFQLLEKRNEQFATSFDISSNSGSKFNNKLKDFNLNILYEDPDYIFINKPAGILVHPFKGSTQKEISLIEKIIYEKSKLPDSLDLDPERPGIVHRLDRMTSGVIVIAKNSKSLWWLSKAFAERKVSKIYTSVGIDNKKEINKNIGDEILIEQPIIRNPKKPNTYLVNTKNSNGLYSKSIFKIINKKEYKTFTLYLFDINLYTGRTHQIRVHQKHFNCPILNDGLYGDKIGEEQSKLIGRNGRLLLHSKYIEFTNYNAKKIQVTCKPEDEFFKFFQ